MLVVGCTSNTSEPGVVLHRAVGQCSLGLYTKYMGVGTVGYINFVRVEVHYVCVRGSLSICVYVMWGVAYRVQCIFSTHVV